MTTVQKSDSDIAPPLSSRGVPTNEDFLSENDIDDLLKEAEERLQRAQQSRALAVTGSGTQRSSLPRLNAGMVAESHFQEINGIVRADSAKLIDHEHRQLAENIYVPELGMKADSKKVCRCSTIFTLLHMM